MRPRSITSASFLASLATLTNAHSWVEEVHQIAPNGTLVGAVGYPRGWIARTSTDPIWKDAIPQWLLPAAGHSAYSGDEILNKYPYEANPKFPMLQASPGDHIALIHLENGHTTLPQNQPLKPRNRGTIFFYGTAAPKPQERLFDVHLVWNRDGTGGDKRGRLLGTRNYDDGQCYQPNPGDISLQRASALAPEGAVHDRELRCQSDIQLPTDLQPGSTYTIYWYWDWPDLNAAGGINLDATKNGIYPWAGTFMRGEKDPHGFTMAAIAKNESYASTVDIKIAAKPQQMGGSSSGGGTMAKAASEWKANQNIYSMAIQEQMANNFQVDIDANKPATGSTGGGNNNNNNNNGGGSSTSSVSAGAPTGEPGNGQPGGSVTVTKTVTVPPATIISTIYVTRSNHHAASSSASSAQPSSPSQPPVFATVSMSSESPSSPSSPFTTSTSVSTLSSTSSAVKIVSTVFVTVTKHVPAGGATSSSRRSSSDPTASPISRSRAVRRSWNYGS